MNLDASFTSTSKKVLFYLQHFVGVVLLEEEEKLLTNLFWTYTYLHHD